MTTGGKEKPLPSLLAGNCKCLFQSAHLRWKRLQPYAIIDSGRTSRNTVLSFIDSGLS